MVNFAVKISTYQRKDGKTPFYINRALTSVFSQEYQNFKVYVIGDRYEDEKEFKTLFEKFPKEKIYFENLPYAHERDKYTDKLLIWKYGGCYAQNYLIEKCIDDGFEYICHLDHDDEWYPNHLSLLNKAISKFNSLWLCTKSEYVSKKVLPQIHSNLEFVTYNPVPERLIHSSTCINFNKIPLRYRNVFEETGISGLPADADLWSRISSYLNKSNLSGTLVNQITCKHNEEGYERK